LKAQERKQINAMTYFNTIEVGDSVTPHLFGNEAVDVGNSEQHGLMGQGSSMAGIREEDFDRKHNKKISISEAIEEEEGKKGAIKGRKKRNNAKRASNADKLNIDEGNQNDSWDSSRGHAKIVDLSS